MLTLPLLLGAVYAAAPAPAPKDAAYAYGSPAFNALTQDSYAVRALKTPDFSTWLEGKYAAANFPLSGGKTLMAGLAARKAAIAAASGDQRDQLAQDTAQWAHTFIKKILPNFSLERGYEFAYAVSSGQRQCLLQSLLISALLQQTGLDAGAVMVWQNDKGQESNLGHVVALVRLPSGKAALLDDASDPKPFMTHQGLLMRDGDAYRFVHPVYDGEKITGFKRADTQKSMALALARPLDLAYLKSQINYYRGERSDGGFMGAGGNYGGKSTQTGLAQSAKFLQQAISDDSQNALATYVLGLVQRKLGQNAQAKANILAGVKLYQAQGHLPAGPADALKWAQSN
ncbi:hypothetical protein FNU79_00810 [Deinococcus detaillensis]|uniref:Protein SirB1 N-terminal domain-containing protein n=1 Tax=Deinococcus detaillensis TaxID=2592048 RepID=A0A553V5S9_9DEIO|nr:hypothetical protein [Deinococcus detaillensis]TSA87827.1 hypothetical protein FNU79_00810 [Deinococcus detaillensis]